MKVNAMGIKALMKRKVFRIVLILVLCGVSAFLLISAFKQDSTPVPEIQIVTVKRGDLTVDITAAGNLRLSKTEDLSFDISGTVQEVFVEEGDSVEEGQLLAELDTSDWDDVLTALERDLLQRQIDRDNAELALEETKEPYSEEDINSTETAVESAQDYLEYAEWMLASAEDAEEDAQDALEQARQSGDPNAIAAAEAALEDAEANVELWRMKVSEAEASLTAAEARLATMEDAPDADEVAIKELQLELSEARFEDAKEALEEALENSPEIIAPFDGFIAKVNVEGGDEVPKGTVAVSIADPNEFEAEIMVSEMDIFQVKLGGEAWVEVDAMQGMSLPAEVTYISPTATIQSGVVNYKVKVKIESLEAVARERQETMQQAIAAGEIPEPLRRAIESGQITQEQAEELMKQGPPPGTTPPSGQGGQQGQLPTVIPEDFQLREGLTVTVRIIIEEATDVLLVPNAAITTEGGQSYVQVVSSTGTTEKRAINTGITDYVNTEVTEGLSEGEQVVVTRGTTTKPTTTKQEPGGSMPSFRPTGGGPPR